MPRTAGGWRINVGRSTARLQPVEQSWWTACGIVDHLSDYSETRLRPPDDLRAALQHVPFRYVRKQDRPRPDAQRLPMFSMGDAQPVIMRMRTRSLRTK